MCGVFPNYGPRSTALAVYSSTQYLVMNRRVRPRYNCGVGGRLRVVSFGTHGRGWRGWRVRPPCAYKCICTGKMKIREKATLENASFYARLRVRGAARRGALRAPPGGALRAPNPYPWGVWQHRKRAGGGDVSMLPPSAQMSRHLRRWTTHLRRWRGVATPSLMLQLWTTASALLLSKASATFS